MFNAYHLVSIVHAAAYKEIIMRIPMPPPWFNQHGMKMSLGGEPIVAVTMPNEVVISSSAARLQIRPKVGAFGQYQVHWLILFSPDEFAQGKIVVSGSELLSAFDVTHEPEGGTFREHFHADAGRSGHYIRQGRFLNIPMPGTGCDGDPNISVFVSEGIKAAVRALLSH